MVKKVQIDPNIAYFNWCKKDVLDTYAIKDGSSSKGNASRARSDERTAFSRAPARGRAVGNSTLGKNYSVGARNSFKTYF